MKKILPFIFWGALFANPLPMTLMWDKDFSPYSGANDLLFAHRALEKGQRKILPISKPGNTSTFSILSRALEMTLFWYPINHFALTVQHEIFGHGYRIRQNKNAHVAFYRFNAPPPYGGGGAATYFKPDLSKITTTELAIISIGGIEATALFAHVLKSQWVQFGKMPAKEAMLYFKTYNDITFYTTSLFYHEQTPGHDIYDYLNELNATYPSNTLSRDNIKWQAFFNLLDPMSFFALFAFWKYVFSGKDLKIPMFKCKGIRFLPNARFTLNPFGIEYYLENYWLYNNECKYAYIRGGKNGNNVYYGLGFENFNLKKWGKNRLDLKMDFWIQPKLLLNRQKDRIGQKGAGVAAFISFKRQMSRGIWSLEIGSKTTGFVQGQDFRGNIIVKESFAYQF